MNHFITWFEIPVRNMQRAAKFYSDIFGKEVQTMDTGDTKMGFLPFQGEGVTGALCEGEKYIPSDKGVLPYLNGGEDLQNVLAKVENAGGKIILNKTLVREDIGYYALIIDTEGNRVALHSKK